MSRGRYLDEVFGSQDQYYRHALVKCSRFCDRIFSVGDYVTKELRFIGPEFAQAAIDTVYNGIPAQQISLAEQAGRQERMRDYAETLLGDRPDYIFTHVARMAVSKGLWRDLRVLEHMEREFRRTRQVGRAVCACPPRCPRGVRRTSARWSAGGTGRWPTARAARTCPTARPCTTRACRNSTPAAGNIKVVYVNQFGWEQAVCGKRMPEDMSFMDIRRGSDVEFGMSIYEPFGIAQLEPLTFGAICVPSRVCGCAGFFEKVTGGASVPNVFIADYCDPRLGRWEEKQLLELDREHRTEHRGQDGRADRPASSARLCPQTDAQTEALLQTRLRSSPAR